MSLYVQTEFQGIQSEIITNNLLPEDKLSKFVLDLINKPILEYTKLEKLQQLHRVLKLTNDKLVLLGTYIGDSPIAIVNKEVYLLPGGHYGQDAYYIIDDFGVPILVGTYEWIPESIRR